MAARGAPRRTAKKAQKPTKAKNAVQKCPFAKGDVPTIGGRRPVNSSYAGGTHPSGIKFTKQGFPDFRPKAKAEVKIRGLSGDYKIDAAKANKAIGATETPKGQVWHHVEDGKTMQLIPRSIHNKVRHTGGSAVIKNGGFDR